MGKKLGSTEPGRNVLWLIENGTKRGEIIGVVTKC